MAHDMSLIIVTTQSAIQVIAQYYQLLRFGMKGYRSVVQNITATASYLAEQIEKIDNGNKFQLMSDKPGDGLPLVAWRIKVSMKMSCVFRR